MSASRSTPGGKTGALWKPGMKPRGCGASPGAAGAESPPPEPHGPGAFPRLRTRGAGFSQPSRLSRLPRDAIPAGFTSLGSVAGLWNPLWSHVLARGRLLRGSDREHPCGSLGWGRGDDVPMPPVPFPLQNHHVGICPVGERDQGWDQGSAPAQRCPRQLQAEAWPHLPPSLCNLSQVPGVEAGRGRAEPHAHTTERGKAREKRLPTPRE